MSSMFMWGCSFGFMLKMVSTKAMGQAFTNKPWQFPKFMLISGVLCSYWDWTRRIYLEDICLMEDRLDKRQQKLEMNVLETGEELTPNMINKFTKSAV